ncbi:Protein kinase domain protein [Labilithrix luteola]|uniref:Protein kinase domain protein n=1 Tax=Labilithrix luteola TaxID=1391654 RepID=A0A0K1PM84_9BACT|nr:SUMF1/EgtB/PvdO family nonheme iron enzyme [Labilithrix luteola]AKU94637.1 Protein kinase domain protein [Labilithrix luteola]
MGPRLGLSRMGAIGCAIVAATALAGPSCRPASSNGEARDHVAPKIDADPDAWAADGEAMFGAGDVASTPGLLAIAPLAATDAGAANDAGAAGDPMANHHESKDELLSLFSIKPLSDKEQKTIQANAFLRSVFGSEGPHRMNQGNKAIAKHTISKEQCLAGLKNIVIQTPEQREKCGADNMVPVWTKGKEPWFCIDVFEFPNKPCELPMVWTPPTYAKKVCELQGKRLCAQTEWNIACRGDPEGGADRRYAYGNKLDLEICHTNRRHRTACVVQTAKTTWDTCPTDTEPSGSFPECRSRFGVFDQHGNVAEVMMRREGEVVYTQLKGSAWFYTELAKEPGEPVPETTTNKTGAYPDHCNFDPRWHVEKLDNAWHVNYHLGFRCCKSIP